MLLFPATVVPLHIFEPRYRQMVEDLLDGPGRFVLGTVLPGHERDLDGSPPVHTIGGLGEIARHERMDDGRFLILVMGLRRVTLREVESERLYRQVEILPLVEHEPDGFSRTSLHEQLVEAVRSRVGQNLQKAGGDDEETAPIEQLPLVQLADILMLHMRLPHSRLMDLYSEPDVEKRALACLEEHQQRPVEVLTGEDDDDEPSIQFPPTFDSSDFEPPEFGGGEDLDFGSAGEDEEGR